VSDLSVALPPGTKLGPYEIVSLLGAGGMGEVYRARDTRLKREVALKILPRTSDEDSGRLRRFQAEARSAAALSHPNIVAIHDVGREDGTSFIISELVLGGTLSRLLDRGPLPVRKLLDLAVPLAEALADAHAHGIVHRDLKPDNILLTAEGVPKIADFGLAKYLAPVPSEDGSRGTSVGDERTREGTIIGTAGYMSPEQAQGAAVDYRSDQFSFGSVLYEMATGARAFQGKSAVETLAAVIHQEPPPAAERNPQIPAPLSWIIERCLAKEPSGRYESTVDLARELGTLRAHSSEVLSGRTAAGEAQKPPRRALGLVLAAAALLAAGLLAGRLLQRESSPPLPSFQQVTFRRGILQGARYTPDGGSVIYSAAWDGHPEEIFTSRLDGAEARPFGLKNADVMSVSSKGEAAIALKKSNTEYFGAQWTLAVVPLAGGSPRELLDRVLDADWSPDASQLAIYRDADTEGLIEYPIGNVLYRTKGVEGSVRIRVSGDGDRVAFVDTYQPGGWDLKIVDRSGAVRTLTRIPDPPYFISGIDWMPGDRELLIGLAREADPGGDVGSLALVDMKGRVREVYRGPGRFRLHDVRPDGRILVDRAKKIEDVMVFSEDQPAGQNLGTLNLYFSDLSEDGKSVLFYDRRSSYLGRTDGSPAARLGDGWCGTLSADGRFAIVQGPSEHEIWMIPTGPGRVLKVPTGELLVGKFPRLLADGKTIVFVATAKDGLNRLYATADLGKTFRPLSKPVATWNTSPFTASSPDGREVAFADPVRGLTIFHLDGRPPRSIPGFDPKDEVLNWSSDGASLFVGHSANGSSYIERFVLATGLKDPWKTLTPSDLTGVAGVVVPFVTRDGARWGHLVIRHISDELWQMTGLDLR
jgi:hypothetical protein